MYRISELASKAGLSRSTLLYYEKLGLIKFRRSGNGYRYFIDADLQRLTLIQQLQAGGLTLQECKASIDSRLDKQLLERRLQSLDKEIAAKQEARKLLSSLLGQDNESLSRWHQTLETRAPDAHKQWLLQQGFSERDAHHIKWLSRNMNEHDQYMNDFFSIFRGLERWGSGSNENTLKALQAINGSPENILDIGCGPGSASLLLAQNTDASVVSLDNDAGCLAFLSQKADELGCSHQITPCCASMMDIPLAENSFDLLWSEASVYIMGFVKALKEWRRLLSDDGYLVVSDLVWINENPLPEIRAFWESDYPDMVTAPERFQQAKAQGYTVISHFEYGAKAWDNYIKPLLQRISKLEPKMPGSPAIADLKKELDILSQQQGQFDYVMMILKKDGK